MSGAGAAIMASYAVCGAAGALFGLSNRKLRATKRVAAKARRDAEITAENLRAVANALRVQFVKGSYLLACGHLYLSSTAPDSLDASKLTYRLRQCPDCGKIKTVVRVLDVSLPREIAVV